MTESTYQQVLSLPVELLSRKGVLVGAQVHLRLVELHRNGARQRRRGAQRRSRCRCRRVARRRRVRWRGWLLGGRVARHGGRCRDRHLCRNQGRARSLPRHGCRAGDRLRHGGLCLDGGSARAAVARARVDATAPAVVDAATAAAAAAAVCPPAVPSRRGRYLLLASASPPSPSSAPRWPVREHARDDVARLLLRLMRSRPLW